MKEKRKKRSLQLVILGLILILVFRGIAFFLEDKRVLSFLRFSEKMAIKSFQILGLDGKYKDPMREKEREDLENTTAEVEVLRVGGERVYFPEFAFYLLSRKKEIEGLHGKEAWRLSTSYRSLEELVEEDVLKELIQLKILLLEARKEGIFVSEEEKEEINSTVSEQLMNIDPVIVAKYFLDPVLVSRVYEENFIATKFYHIKTKKMEEKQGKEEVENLFLEAYEKWESQYSIEVFRERIQKLRENEM